MTARALSREPFPQPKGAVEHFEFFFLLLFRAQPCAEKLASVSELSMCKINPNVDVTLGPRGPLTAAGLGRIWDGE